MLKRPSEIIAENPGIKKYWMPNDIGYLLRMRLVRGQKLNGGRGGCLVEQNDVMKLFRFIIDK